MNPKYQKLIDTFKSSHVNLTVTTIIDYDNKYLVVEAVENINKKDYNDPLYAIEKRTGKVTHFSPAFDFDKFFEATEKRLLYSINQSYEDE